MRHLLRNALIGPLLLASAAPQARADYPDRLIKILVPIPPGGAPDLVARLVAQGLSEAFGQSLAVENRPGATAIWPRRRWRRRRRAATRCCRAPTAELSSIPMGSASSPSIP